MFLKPNVHNRFVLNVNVLPGRRSTPLFSTSSSSLSPFSLCPFSARTSPHHHRHLSCSFVFHHVVGTQHEDRDQACEGAGVGHVACAAVGHSRHHQHRHHPPPPPPQWCSRNHAARHPPPPLAHWLPGPPACPPSQLALFYVFIIYKCYYGDGSGILNNKLLV